MPTFQSRWLDWKPTHTPIQRTDRTDKSPSVSFVSASPERFQPETVFGAEHDSIREQARSNGSNSPPGWGDATAAVEWFNGWSPPSGAFQLKPGITILDPQRWRQSIAADIRAGPNGPRARYGALQDDLRRLHDLFGGGAERA